MCLVPILRVSTWMNDAIHVQVEVVELDAIRIGLRGVNRYFLVGRRILLGRLFVALNHNGRIFTTKPSEKCWNSHLVVDLVCVAWSYPLTCFVLLSANVLSNLFRLDSLKCLTIFDQLVHIFIYIYIYVCVLCLCVCVFVCLCVCV